MTMPTIIPDNDLTLIDPSELIKDGPFRSTIELANSQIAGLMFLKNRDEILSNLNIGDILTLVREPDNIYDEFAIRIEDCRNRKIGYIQRKVNRVIASLMDGGKHVYAKVKTIGEDYGDDFVIVTVYMNDTY